MLALVLGFVIGGFRPVLPEGLPVAPVDVVAGSQAVELRAPLVARTPGTRLVLFVRNLDGVIAEGEQGQAAFQRAVPPGSVRARLSGSAGEALEFAHTAYTFHRGFAGIVLTEKAPGTGRTLYDTLALESDVALENVRFIWLDQLTRRVEDLGQLR